MDVHSTSSTCSAEEAPAGYKQTEVGVIPEDWEVKPMAELFTFQNGVNAEKSAYGRGVPFINVLEVITHSTITETRIPGRITLTAPALNAFAVQRGDVLFNRTSETQEEVGLASVYVGTEAVVFGGFVIRARPRDSRLDSSFTAYALRSPIVRSQIVARGQGAVRANIGQKDLSRVQVFLPTKAEQEAIAEALSDVDKLLGSLEKLIAKKRAIKQAAMQQLLTGKTRLPGFIGEWELGKLADFGVFRSGSGFPLVFQGHQSGDYPFFKVSDLNHKGNELLLKSANHWISEDVRRTLGATKFSAGSIIFAKIGAAIFLERKRLLSRESCLDNNMMAFSLTAHGACEQFFHYLFLRIELGKLVSTTALPSLSGREIGAISVSLPPPDEQRAIATVLSDMDEEIAALERCRDKTHAIKQGMMQQLLTGRVRLVSAQEGNGHGS